MRILSLCRADGVCYALGLGAELVGITRYCVHLQPSRSSDRESGRPKGFGVPASSVAPDVV